MMFNSVYLSVCNMYGFSEVYTSIDFEKCFKNMLKMKIYSTNLLSIEALTFELL